MASRENPELITNVSLSVVYLMWRKNFRRWMSVTWAAMQAQKSHSLEWLAVG
ncbi:hypothetical protein ACFIQF_11175 [Comamonas sp. J-3]